MAISPSLSPRSVFDTQSIAEIYEYIRQVYLRYKLPWIIGLSGGKDSTCALQVIWNALSQLPKEQLTRPMYCISGDTGVETPQILDRIDRTLAAINLAAQDRGLPISAHKTQPLLADSFWVCLCGRGYAAPTTQFRWCTERLKIAPNNFFVREKVSEHGRIIMVLGVRSAESKTRQASIDKHRIPGHDLQINRSLRNAYVFAPIERWTTDDVWTYLLQSNPTPWGMDNRELLTLYRQADGGECPLVVDTSSPSCGSSRFGCWLCTVAANRSLESLIKLDEYFWMYPLWDVYLFLKETTVPERKLEFRDFRRDANGEILFGKRQQRPVPGKYFMHVRQRILRMLLQAQADVRADGPDPSLTLITDLELRVIRHLWRTDPRSPDTTTLDTICAEFGIPLPPWMPEDGQLLVRPQPPRKAGPDAIQLAFSELVQAVSG